MAGATDNFKQRVQAAFSQIQPGQIFTYRRTFTEADVALFCGVTGDFNPYHLDDTFARESWYGRRIVPGLLTASMVTHIGGMIGFLAMGMNFEYLLPVYPGDTISCTVTVMEKDTEKRLLVCEARYVNQDGAEVLRARFHGFPADIRLAR
ncbi:MAG TPA: MaoC family dehydratase [Ktedonobacterales bacterium]|nr:MaoC family dehydratase [Ktedonobacterales bacterium]